MNLVETPHIDLLRGLSLEATLPSRSEIAATQELVDRGTSVYLSAPPRLSPIQLANLAREVRLAGLEPVPHIVARTYPNHERLGDFLSRISGEAGVSRALVLGGDRAEPAGPFPDALAVIESDLLQKHGIANVGISAYPDGHPKIAHSILAAALKDKLAAAHLRGLAVHVVTQFCFDPERLVTWLRRLRLSQIHLPVRLGIAGPTSVRALTRYALRCGVRASVRGMLNPNAKELLGGRTTPDYLIQSLHRQFVQLNSQSVQLHFFTFGGLVETARWVSAAAAENPLAE